MLVYSVMQPRYSEWLKKAQAKASWQGAIERGAAACMRGRDRYLEVEHLTGVPWAWIACAHMRECDNNFRGVLHNGEHIIGTGARTHLEPAGRGPFNTWEEAALDALRIKGFTGKPKEWWTIERICFCWEVFNGPGYANKGLPSPYLWSGTTIYQRGKYVSDRNYSASAVDQQLGCVAVYLRVLDMEKELGLRANSRKLSLIGNVRNWVKAAIATAGGIFTMDNVEYFKEWLGSAQGILSTGTLVTLICGGIGVWWLMNTIDAMVVSDYETGHYTPSGEDKLPSAMRDEEKQGEEKND